MTTYDGTVYPDATNTGVPSGTNLTTYNGDLVIDTPGAVISGLNITGTVYINAPNVTIENCSITSTDYACVNIATGVTGSVVQNCTINGTGNGPAGQNGIGGQGTFLNNNIYNCENGINVEGSNTVIQGNYIHNLADSDGTAGHYDGIAVDGGFNNVNISGNAILGRDTSCIFICNDFGPMNNIVVNANLLLGQNDAAASIYVIEKAGNPAQITNVQVTNNVIGKGYYFWADVESTSPVWTNNIDYATGELVSDQNVLSPLSGSGTTAPTVLSLAASGAGIATGSGDLKAGSVVTLTVSLSEAVTVGGGAPTLTLNDGGKATYSGGSGTNALTFTYTVAAGQNTSDLSVTAVSLNGATVQDRAGNAANLTGAVTAPSGALQIDTTAPSAPTIAASTTAATLASTHVEVLTGTAEAKSTVAVFDGTTKIGTTTANSTGAWSFTTTALSTGNHSFTAAATDAAGNTGASSSAVALTIAAPPAAPTIGSFSTDSGIVGDHITNDATPTLSGTAVAGGTVTVFDGTTKVGSTTADANGNWSVTTTTLADGSHSLTATETTSGGTSGASTALSLTVDTVAPSAPTLVASTSAATLSSTHVEVLTGTAEAGSTITVFDGVTKLGTAAVGSGGTWSYTTAALSTGNHSFTAAATDAAGNTGGSSAATVVAVAGSPPAPTISSFSNDSGVVGDHITNDNTLTLTGTAAANSVVTVFDGTTAIGSTTADAKGSWDYITSVLNDAVHVLTATATDSAGTSSHSASLSVTIDTLAPDAPVLVNDSIVNTDHVLLNGTGEANSKINIYDGDGVTLVGTTTASADGTWSVTTSSLSDGSHDLQATATDAAGNVSAMSLALDPVIGEPAPVAPVIVSFSTDSGVVGDHITNDGTLTLTGTAVANSTVKVFDGTTLVGTATANSSGAWTVTTPALANGGHSLTATATNSGGTSSASGAFAVTIDTVAPSAPTIAASTLAATLASTHVEVLTGKAEANSTVTVFDGTTKLGTATTNASGAWSYTTAALSTGAHAFTASATDAAGNTSAASSSVSVTIAAASTPPSAPTIASFSTDSGVVGDHITNDSTLTLMGTAVANSTVKVFDGTTLVGTATANSSGAWTVTTPTLANGGHSLTATATNSGGTSSASGAFAVTIDTVAPSAPTIAASTLAATLASTHVEVLTGKAEANSTVTVFDGTTKLGTATTNASGAWSYTTAALSTGAHAFTASATDAAGNTSAASSSVSVTIAAASTPPSAPTIASFSTDSGVVGDHITNDSTLTLMGTAVANSTVKVFDGSHLVGSAKVDADGDWTLTTSPLRDGQHSLVATDTSASGHVSAASSPLSVTIDTHAPTAPKMAAYSDAGASVGSTTALDDFVLKGHAESGSVVKVFDGTTLLGSATTNGSGTWSFDTGHLDSGVHKFTSVAVDAAGNASATSSALKVDVTGSTTANSDLELTNVVKNSSGVTVTGTADPNSMIKLFDGNSALGSVSTDSTGAWSFTKAGLSNTVHTITAQEVDSKGNVIDKSSGAAIVGSQAGEFLSGTSGNDLFIGKGQSDTFVFAPNFGNDIIKDFNATGMNHDIIQFNNGPLDNFASVLANASQVGHDVVIAAGGDTLTLKNVKIGTLDSHDFHFS